MLWYVIVTLEVPTILNLIPSLVVPVKTGKVSVISPLTSYNDVTLELIISVLEEKINVSVLQLLFVINKSTLIIESFGVKDEAYK